MRRAAALCVTWRVCLQCMGPAGTRGPVVLCRGAISGTILFAAAVDFYFDIGSSLTSARGRGRCGRAAPATNEACNHETCADLSADLAGGLQRACWCCSCAAVHSSAVSVGLCRDAPRGRPMCYEDEGALTSIEEVNVRACPKKGFSPNMFAKHRRFFHGLSASGGPLPNPVPV